MAREIGLKYKSCEVLDKRRLLGMYVYVFSPKYRKRVEEQKNNSDSILLYVQDDRPIIKCRSILFPPKIQIQYNFF